MRYHPAAALILLPALLCPVNLWACSGQTPPLKEEDLHNPPARYTAHYAEMLAIIGRVSNVAKRSDGATQVDMDVVEIVQGQAAKAVSVEYNSCHDVVAKIGDVIPVLALQRRDGSFYAP